MKSKEDRITLLCTYLIIGLNVSIIALLVMYTENIITINMTNLYLVEMMLLPAAIIVVMSDIVMYLISKREKRGECK